MPGILVQNTLTEAVPNASTVRFAMDFGNIQEILAGQTIVSCLVQILTVTFPPLTFNPGSVSINNGYLVSALFSDGAPGDYEVQFTITMNTGQTLPKRVGVLTLI